MKVLVELVERRADGVEAKGAEEAFMGARAKRELFPSDFEAVSRARRLSSCSARNQTSA